MTSYLAWSVGYVAAWADANYACSAGRGRGPTGFGPPLDLFRLFARRPARARGILGWGRYYLSRDLTLTLRDRELVILRTTALLGHSTNGVFTWRRTRTRQSSTTARSGR
jgi:hypothetical protein